jgi:phosphoglycerate dehydrogenase-like enzyme
MKIWTNTKTLDGLVDDLDFTDDKNIAELALLGSKPIDLNEFPKLRGIFRAGVSTTNVPVEGAEKQGIAVRIPSDKTVNYIYEETANFTCYLVLRMLYKHVGSLDPWIKYNRTVLNHRNLLIIGMGKIGSKVADKMKKLIHVDTYDIVLNTETELKELIQIADCISIHIPNTPENESFFNKEKLSWMKDGSVLINTARGPIVDEDALYKEIKNNRIFAAFDVYWKEPYIGKLKEFYPDRFYMTPHIASTCNEFLQGAAEDLRLFISELEEEKND